MQQQMQQRQKMQSSSRVQSQRQHMLPKSSRISSSKQQRRRRAASGRRRLRKCQGSRGRPLKQIDRGRRARRIQSCEPVPCSACCVVYHHMCGATRVTREAVILGLAVYQRANAAEWDA